MKYTSKLFVVFCLLAGLCGTVVMGCAPKAPAPAATEEPVVSEEATPAAEEAAPAAAATATTEAK
ncbi:MAG: hypothetical protein ABH886_05335 [Candidatus Desantisbacteria bacterium]